jgi:putative addiction module component (TIGR02574 family)
MKTFEEVASEAFQLPTDQQLKLANQILMNVDPPSDPQVDKAWDEEIQRRIRQYDNGEVAGIPGPEVFRAIRQKIRK